MSEENQKPILNYFSLFTWDTTDLHGIMMTADLLPLSHMTRGP